MTIAIHEFSTGIRVVGTANNWHSVGFTGYMNCTIDPIPPVVQNAISNQLFSVPVGDATDTPAMVGREVEENGEAWSVLAVVTRANDEKGRGISVYRYFLTEGKGKLEDLVRWHSQSGGLKFNPFDSKTPNQYHEYAPPTVTNTDLLGKDEFKELLRKEGTDTIIVPNDLVCPPLILNELALRLQVKRYLLENYKSKNYQLTEAEVKELISYQLTQLTSEKKKDYTQRYFKKSMEAGQLTLNMYEAEDFFDYQANQIYDQLSEIERDKRILESLINSYRQKYPYETEQQIDFWAEADLSKLKLTALLKKDRIVKYEKEQLKKEYMLSNYNYRNTKEIFDSFADYKTANSNEQELNKCASDYLFEHYKGYGFKLSENYIMLLIESRIINHEYIRNVASQILANCAIAWGYNVKGLTKPASFQAIFPVSEESRNILGQNVKEGSSLPAPVAEESPIITSSRNMIFQGIDTILVDSNAKALQDLADWIDRDSQGLWGKAYQEYCIDFWQDINQIAENYKIAKDDAYKKGLYLVEDQISPALKKGSYCVSHAPQNLVILSQIHWKLLRDDMIELIWTYKGKSKYLALHNSGLYSKLADFFADMSYQKQLESKSLAATHNLALLFTGLTNPKGIPAKLWEKSLLNLRRSDKRTEILKSKDSNVQILAIRKIPTIRDSITDWIKQFIESAPQLQPLELRLLPIVIYLALGTLLGIILEERAKIAPMSRINKLFTVVPQPSPAPSNNEEETFKNITARTLDQIVGDFDKHLNKNKEETKVGIEGIFIEANPGAILEYNTKNENYTKWVDSIKKYQSKFGLISDGVIENGKDTANTIRCQLYQNFKVLLDSKTQQNCKIYGITLELKPEKPKAKTLPSPEPQTNVNVNSLNALVIEIQKNHPNKSLERVQVAVAKILSKDTKPHEELIDPNQAQELTELVKQYQGGGEPDGKIDINGKTYERLKGDVAKELFKN